MGSVGAGVRWLRRKPVAKCVVADTWDISAGRYALLPGQLVVHGCGLYGPWLANENDATEIGERTRPVLRTSYARPEWCESISDRYCVFHGSSPFLQEVPCAQAGQDAPLFNVQEMRAEDGPSLPMAIHMPWSTQL